jgi:hypothetical protein
MGKSWEIDAEGAAVSWPHVSPHCPEIHTYSHTQQFTRINCVIPTVTSAREGSQVAGLDPKPSVATGSYGVATSALWNAKSPDLKSFKSSARD